MTLTLIVLVGVVAVMVGFFFRRASGNGEKVTIEIDAKWLRISKSPLYIIIAALQGISISFAPLFLYWSGSGGFHSQYHWLIVPTCFLLIFAVPFFYYCLGGAVIRELRKHSTVSAHHSEA